MVDRRRRLLRIGVNTFAYAGHGEIRERVMLERFRDPETVRRLNVETLEMLAFRGGGAAHPHRWQRGGDDSLDLYDIENIRYLARQPWMMTCTDGRTPSPRRKFPGRSRISHCWCWSYRFRRCWVLATFAG